MRENLLRIIKLCEDKVYDKKQYIDILKKMNLPEPVAHENRFVLQLENMTDLKAIYLSDKNINNPLVRLRFGEEWVYWDLWRRIRDSGLGHLSSFCIKGGVFNIEITLSIGLSRGNYESKNNFEKRKVEFERNLKYDIVNLHSTKLIKNTEKNVSLFLEFINTFCNPITYEFSTWKNGIRIVKLRTKNITPYGIKDEKPDEFDESSLERIKKCCMDAVDAIDTVEAIPKLKETCNSILGSTYHLICDEIGFQDDYYRKYENIVLPKKVRNRLLQEKEWEFGKTIPLEEMLNTAKEIDEKIKNLFAKDMCIWITDGSWHMGYEFSGRFSKESIFFVMDDDEICNNTDGYKFDEYLINKDENAYEIGASHALDVKTILEVDYFVSNIELSLRECDYNYCISEIKGRMDNLLFMKGV